jgi:hypothetical protein
MLELCLSLEGEIRCTFLKTAENELELKQFGELQGIEPFTRVEMIEDEKMTRFIFRDVITDDPKPASNRFGGAPVRPFEAAQFMNAVQDASRTSKVRLHYFKILCSCLAVLNPH